MPAEARWASVCSYERYPAACFFIYLRGRDRKPRFPYLPKLGLPPEANSLNSGEFRDQAIDAVGRACVNTSLATEAHVRGCLFGLSFSTYMDADGKMWADWRAEKHLGRDGEVRDGELRDGDHTSPAADYDHSPQDAHPKALRDDHHPQLDQSSVRRSALTGRPRSLVAFCSSARFVEPRWILSRPGVPGSATSDAGWRERERQRWMSCIAGGAVSISFLRVGAELPDWVLDTFCSQMTEPELSWLMPSQRAEGAALCSHTCKLNASEAGTLHPLSWLGLAAKVIAGAPRE